jgi:FKBP-type peptidyl-prolyl cis-trans isomerase
MLVRNGKLVRRPLRPGLTLLLDLPGHGEPVRRHQKYRIRLRMWLNGGEPVRWNTEWTPGTAATRGESDETLFVELRIDRRSLVNGLFYGLEGMRVGGTRRLEIAPHLAYGHRGVPGVVPPNAVLRAEITVLAAIEHTEQGSCTRKGSDERTSCAS